MGEALIPHVLTGLQSVEHAFAKVKHWMRLAQKRTVGDTWRQIGDLNPTLQPTKL